VSLFTCRLLVPPNWYPKIACPANIGNIEIISIKLLRKLSQHNWFPDKILALVSTQLIQKVDKNDNIPTMQMQMQQQQQQNVMNMMMMSIMPSMLNHGTSQTTTQPPQLPLLKPFRPWWIKW
jgi:hypothetical protein